MRLLPSNTMLTSVHFTTSGRGVIDHSNPHHDYSISNTAAGVNAMNYVAKPATSSQVVAAPKPLNNTARLPTSSPASSHKSAGWNSRIGSDSPYEIIYSPSNSAPSLPFSLSNNGSDIEEGSTWNLVERHSSSGSTGTHWAVAGLELLQQAGDDRPNIVPDGYAQQSPPRSAPPTSAPFAFESSTDTGTLTFSGTGLQFSPEVRKSIYPNDPHQQETLFSHSPDTLHHSPPSASPASSYSLDSEMLVDLDLAGFRSGIISAVGCNTVPFRSEWEILRHANPTANTDIQTDVSTDTSLDLEDFELINAQAIPEDSPRWWVNQLINEPHVFNNQFGGDYATRLAFASTSINVASTSIPHSRATLHRNLTSSHCTSRGPDGLSVVPAGPVRSLKRPYQADRWDLANGTSMLENAGDRSWDESASAGSISSSPERVRKRARQQKSARSNNGYYQVQPLSTHHVSEFMDDSNFRREADRLSPTYRAEILGNSSPHQSNEIPQLRIEYPPSTDDIFTDGYQNIPPFAGDYLDSGLLNARAHEGYLMNARDEMEDSMGGEGSDFNSPYPSSSRVEDISSNNEISSNPVSPSERPVNTPSGSPNPIYYGPPRPPQMQLSMPQPPYNSYSYNYSKGDAIGASNNWYLQNPPGTWPPQAPLDLDWQAPQCGYDVRHLDLIGADDGEAYEAEDENLGPTQNTNLGVPQKRRKAFTADRRSAVRLMRKRGACMRCQFLRESCDMKDPCSNCEKVIGKQKIWNMPCTVMRITEAQLFRRGNSKFKQESAMILPIRQWNHNSPRRYLTLGRPTPIARKYWGQETTIPTFRIQCQEFIPKPGDILWESWNEDGEGKKYSIPPFAGCDVEEISDALKVYVRDTFDLYKEDMVSEEHNPLIRLVFREAVRFSEGHWCKQPDAKNGRQQEACMLKDALKIWVLTRLAYEGFGIIYGNEEFGVDVIDNPKSPYHGTAPIPPILDHQIDTVGITYMIRLKESVLKMLKTRIGRRKETDWYEIFLTMFVLLHNLEYVYKRQYQYRKRHENTPAAEGDKNIQFFTETWMAEWEKAAKMLITHFQVALKGAVPFTFNWEGNSEGDKEGDTDASGKAKGKKKAKGKGKATGDLVTQAKKAAGMDDAAVEFMKEVCTLVRPNVEDFKRLRGEGARREYDRDMVWVSQLFLDV